LIARNSILHCVLDISADSDACPLRSIPLYGNHVITWCPGEFMVIITMIAVCRGFVSRTNYEILINGLE